MSFDSYFLYVLYTLCVVLWIYANVHTVFVLLFSYCQLEVPVSYLSRSLESA